MTEKSVSHQPAFDGMEAKSGHETLFSFFLLALAFLFRNHPSITYPEILYVFVAFLLFNFLYNRFLKQRARAAHLAYSPVFVNGILITWAVHYSGGPSSYLWVMYLLPIFTACLLYDLRGIVLSTLYVVALYASAHQSHIMRMDPAEGLQFLSKTALLVLSASITARLAYAEREAKMASLAQRRNYEESLDRLWGRSSKAGAEEKSDSLLMGGIHDVNTALSIILGSAQLLLLREKEDDPRREDLSRIESSVRLGKIILQNLFLLGRARVDWPRQASSLHDALREALEQCRGEIRSKGIMVDTRYDAVMDQASLNGQLIHQALLNFLFASMTSSPAGGALMVSTKEDGDSIVLSIENQGAPVTPEEQRRYFDPMWIAPGRGKGVGLGLYVGKEIVTRHGGVAEVDRSESGGKKLLVRLPLSKKKDGGPPIQLPGLTGNAAGEFIIR
jgi:signal transduction histidine kinase